MSKKVSSSAPCSLYLAAISTGSPASRSATKLTPLTTRPPVTSRQGMMRLASMAGQSPPGSAQAVITMVASGRRAGPPQARPAPEGLEPAAPILLEQDWTGDRGEASREPRPARPRAVREATSVGAIFLAIEFVSPRLGRRKVQVAAVDGTAADHAMNALVFDLTQRFDIGHARQAARGDDGNCQCMREPDRCFNVDAAEHAIAANVGVDNGLDAVVLEFFSQINHFVAGELAPAVSGDLAVFGVKPDDDVAGKGGAGIMQEARVLHGGGADDDVAQARVQVALNGVEIADTTAQLDVDFAAHFRQDALDGGLVFGLSRKCAVQVHQVQAARALVNPAARHGGRVITENGGLIHVALFEANAVTVFQVNRGDE